MNGTAASVSALVLERQAGTHVGTGDFNGDGKRDLVWRNNITGQTAVWLMNGTPASRAPS